MNVITSTWLDASLAIDNRMLGPIQTVLYLLIASMLYWTVRSRIRSLRPLRWAIGAVTVAALVLWAPNAGARTTGGRSGAGSFPRCRRPTSNLSGDADGILPQEATGSLDPR